jgi:hypothetical protein
MHTRMSWNPSGLVLAATAYKLLTRRIKIQQLAPCALQQLERQRKEEKGGERDKNIPTGGFIGTRIARGALKQLPLFSTSRNIQKRTETLRIITSTGFYCALLL